MADKNEYSVNESGFTLQLDKKVILTFASIIGLCILLLAFNVIRNKECHLITIKTTTNSSLKHFKDQFFTGEVIQFTAKSKGAEKFEWDFGDDAPLAKSQATTHAYLKPGNFIVQVKVNEKCIEFVELQIVNSPQTANAMMDAMKEDKPYIMGPEVVTAGEPASFQDLSQGSSVWDWTILNSPNISAQTGSTVSFTFPVPGTKIINLVTNGDVNRTAQKTITIVAKQVNASANAGMAAQPMALPPPMPMPNKRSNEMATEEEEEVVATKVEKKVEEKPVVPILPDMEFKNMIENITNGKSTPESVNAYLCNGTNTKVHKNGEWDTWGNFAREISGKKRIDIKAVKVYRDENNCVTTLEIEYKKRLL